MAAMNENDFQELLDGVKEVGLIEKGELEPSREFATKNNLHNEPANRKVHAICISNEDDELIPLKIYSVVLHPQQRLCTVKDENSETLICPIDWFLPVEFPENIERTLEKVELALA